MIDHGPRSSPSAPGQALARDYGTFSSATKVRLVCLLRVANGPKANLQMFFLNGFFGEFGGMRSLVTVFRSFPCCE